MTITLDSVFDISIQSIRYTIESHHAPATSHGSVQAPLCVSAVDYQKTFYSDILISIFFGLASSIFGKFRVKTPS